MCADFVLGSVAEVERLWSILRRLLPEYRKSCTPMLAEAFLFLKVNSDYWDLPLVCQTLKKQASDKVLAQLARDEQESDIAGMNEENVVDF